MMAPPQPPVGKQAAGCPPGGGQAAAVQSCLGGKAGFTLLEVLVAVAILSITLSSLLGSQIAAIRATDHARRLSSVAFLAENQLVEIEWELKREGWGTDDKTFEGDFSEEGWPDVEYICTVDLIEMPDYNELMAAKEASESEGDEMSAYMDAGDQAFSVLGMAWPIVKEAIEQSIRKSWCTVRWSPDGEPRRQSDAPECAEHENECLTIATFWTDPEKLKTLPQFGGEAGGDGEEGGGEDGGEEGKDGRGGAGGTGSTGGRGTGSSGGPTKPGMNQSIPQGPGGRGGMR
jgi:prepilin-type N-terminal cleavage/methylation domain-containing protein